MTGYGNLMPHQSRGQLRDKTKQGQLKARINIARQKQIPIKAKGKAVITATKAVNDKSETAND